MTMGPIEGTLTEQDMRAARGLHQRPHLLMAAFGALILGAICVSGWLYNPYELLGWGLFIALCIGLGRWLRARNFRQNKAMQEPTVWSLGDDGLSFKRTTSAGIVPWNHLLKWRKNESLLLLYPARHAFYVFPKRWFQNEQDFVELQRILGDRVGKPA